MAQKVHDQTACRWHHERHGENGREAAVRRRVGSPHQGTTTRCRHLAKRSLMPEGSDDGRVEKNVLYERTHEWKGSPLWSPWWLIAKGATDHFEVFTLDGGSILPVFSDEDEAEMYLWFERARRRLGGAQVLLRRADIGALRTMLGCRESSPRSIAGDHRGAICLAR
jgi:hypothetical protein